MSNKGDNPKTIYLIDMGDQIAWCDSPDPDGNIEPEDVTEYIRADVVQADLAARDEVIDAIAEDCPNCNNVGYIAHGSNAEGWEQEQCQFCYTVKNSRFNINEALRKIEG